MYGCFFHSICAKNNGRTKLSTLKNGAAPKFLSHFFQHFGYNEIPHHYNQISPQYLEDSYPAAAHQKVYSAVYPQKGILHSGGFKPIFKPRVSSGLLRCMASLNLHQEDKISTCKVCNFQN